MIIICLILTISFFTIIGVFLENSYDENVGKYSYVKVDSSTITTSETIAKNIVKIKIYDEYINLEQCQLKKLTTIEKLKTDYKYFKITEGACIKKLSYKDIKEINKCNKTFEDIPKYIEVNKKIHNSIKEKVCIEKKNSIKVYSYEVIAEAGFKDKLSYNFESFKKTIPYFFTGLSAIVLSPFYMISYFI